MSISRDDFVRQGGSEAEKADLRAWFDAEHAPASVFELVYGDVIDNGATVLAFEPFPSGARGGTVLCRFRGPQPFVTWYTYPRDGVWFAETGHYFGSLLEATLDFARRTGQEVT